MNTSICTYNNHDFFVFFRPSSKAIRAIATSFDSLTPRSPASLVASSLISGCAVRFQRLAWRAASILAWMLRVLAMEQRYVQIETRARPLVCVCSGVVAMLRGAQTGRHLGWNPPQPKLVEPPPEAPAPASPTRGVGGRAQRRAREHRSCAQPRGAAGEHGEHSEEQTLPEASTDAHSARDAGLLASMLLGVVTSAVRVRALARTLTARFVPPRARLVSSVSWVPFWARRVSR